MARLIAFAVAAAFLVACASPRGELKSQFVEFGMKEERASCMAKELDERLERDDAADVANFIRGLNEAGSAGGALDALLDIDNAAAAAAIVPASIACAFARD